MSDIEKMRERLQLKYFKGFPLSLDPVFKDELVESAMDYKARNGDIILFSYPKTGSTWLLYIVWLILHKGKTLQDMNHIPIAEVVGAEAIEALPKPRCYKYHLPYDRLNINERAKYIYIHRKPEDTALSYYHFMKEFSRDDFDFDFFFDAFVSGNVVYGDYFDNVLSAYAHRNECNLLILSYENLKKNTRGEILRVAEFLGDEYHETLTTDVSLLDKILEVTSFDYMKRNVKFGGVIEEKKINFFRKGTVGDGKNSLTEEQRRRLKDRVLEKMKGTEFVDFWSP